MPTVKVGDINMYYEVQGDGYPLVMIMGLSCSLDWWDPPLVNGLSKKFKLVMFDNRGAGRTDKPEVEYSNMMFADDTAGLMDALNIQRANILGISMGGEIAQELALNYPEKVEKLILCSTNCGGEKAVEAEPHVMEMLTGDLEGVPPEDLVKGVLYLCFTQDFIETNPDYRDDFIQRLAKAPIPPDAYSRQVKADFSHDAYERLPGIKSPTLILHGKKDIAEPPENAEILANRIPGAKLVYFHNSAHLLCEESEKVLATILDFLR